MSAPARPSIGASRSSPSAALIIALTICTASGPRLAISRCERLCPRNAFALPGHLVDEAERQALLGREHGAGQSHAAHDRRAEPAHEPLRARPTRRHAEPRFRKTELDSALGDADIGDGRKLEAAAKGVARQRRDQRNAQARQRLEGAMARARPVAPHLERRRGSPQAPMSPPAQNALPSPERIATRVSR